MTCDNDLLLKTLEDIATQNPHGPGTSKWMQEKARAALSQQGVVETRITFEQAAILAEGVKLTRTSHPDAEAIALGWKRGVDAVARSFRSNAKRTLPQERIAGSGRDAVADDLLTPQEAWQTLMDKDDRNSPAEYQDMCLITAKELAEYMRRPVADVPQAQVTGCDPETIERCARLAENFYDNSSLETGNWRPSLQKKIAAEIRALASHSGSESRNGTFGASAGAEEGKK